MNIIREQNVWWVFDAPHILTRLCGDFQSNPGILRSPTITKKKTLCLAAYEKQTANFVGTHTI